MHLFKNAIGLGIDGAGRAGADAIGLKKFLKFNTNKFSTFVVKANHGMGIAAEPGMVEGTGNGVAFFVRDSKEFNVVGSRFNPHGEGQYVERWGRRRRSDDRAFWGLEQCLRNEQRANEVDMNFFPPGVGVTVDLDTEVAILLALFLVVLTCGAQLNMFLDICGKQCPMKVLCDGFFHVHCTQMCKHGVVP